MRNNAILPTGELASAPTQCHSTPTNRILVVDDDADIRQVNAEVLRCFGYQTDTAEDGEAGWEKLRSHCYDLLITDNKMPKLSGVELVKKVRSARMALPVILASGTIPTDEFKRNPWLQPVATLVKPFSSGQSLETHYWRICVRSKWLVKPYSSGELLKTVNEFLAPPTVPAVSWESPPARSPAVFWERPPAGAKGAERFYMV